MRESFFGALHRLARTDESIILLLGDVGALVLDDYRRDLPQRCLNVGIAEENMMGVAAGMALSGYRVFVFTHAVFATTSAYEQIKLDICLQQLPVKIVGVGPGLDYSTLGPSHHAGEDIALMRVLPNMTILSPCDSVQAAAFPAVALDTPGPVYIRLDRRYDVPLYQPGNTFRLGFTILEDGDPDVDRCLVATGSMVHRALEMARGERVIDVYRLKPLDEGALAAAIGRRDVVTLEEHNIIGGLGSLVAEILAAPRLRRIGIPDAFCLEYGPREALQEWILNHGEPRT